MRSAELGIQADWVPPVGGRAVGPSLKRITRIEASSATSCKVPCSSRNLSLQHVRKFPVPLRREFVGKLLNLVGDRAPESQRKARFCKIPCLFPCYQGIWVGDWFDMDCRLSQPVRSQRADSRFEKTQRLFRDLADGHSVSAPQKRVISTLNAYFSVKVSSREISISEFQLWRLGSIALRLVRCLSGPDDPWPSRLLSGVYAPLGERIQIVSCLWPEAGSLTSYLPRPISTTNAASSSQAMGDQNFAR